MTTVHLNMAKALRLCGLPATEEEISLFSCSSKAVSAIMETLRSLAKGGVHPVFQVELMGCVISISRCRVAVG